MSPIYNEDIVHWYTVFESGAAERERVRGAKVPLKLIQYQTILLQIRSKYSNKTLSL